MSFLEVSNISSIVEERIQLQDISFQQEQFQKLAIAGATGSGKTTLLKIIAGLVQPTAGNVLFENKRVKGPYEKLLPGHPAIAYLSQHFELRNNYRVEELLEMANKLSEVEAARIYSLCRIDHLLSRWTNQLSGGEKQRIVLAGLLTTAPRLLLLDEPFSNLDAIHKSILKSVLHNIGEELQLTCILVAHEPHDMLSWADEIIVLRDGTIIQSGSTLDIYRNPVDDYTASLFGRFNKLTPALANAFGFTGKQVYARPNDFQIITSANNALEGIMQAIRFMGSFYEVDVQVLDSILTIHTTANTWNKGDAVFVQYAGY